MSKNEVISEKRDVKYFNKIVLKEHHEGELYITIGKREGLTIEAPEDIITRIESSVKDDTLTIKTTGTILEKIGDAFRTSLTRKVIKYHITVRELQSLDVAGLIKAEVDQIRTKTFFVIIRLIIETRPYFLIPPKSWEKNSFKLPIFNLSNKEYLPIRCAPAIGASRNAAVSLHPIAMPKAIPT